MKSYTHILIGLISLFFLLGCNQEDEDRVIEKFSQEKPYAIQIAKERSFYQAEKLTDRLHGMDLDAYLIKFVDSIENDGSWFYIMCDNIKTLDSVKSKRKYLEEKFNLTDLKIVAFSDFQEATFDLDSVKLEERKKITARKPSIDNDIFDVIEKFPESNSLYLQKTFIVNTPKERDDLKGFSAIYDFSMDLPRGITKKMILQNTSAFSEVVYKDNLYGDRVTIDIGKLRNPKPQMSKASIINLKNTNSFEIAGKYADLILETGDYLFEEKKEIEVSSFNKLYGYKVTIEPKKDYFRTYLILVDQTNEYIIYCQSTEKTEKELLEILSDFGKGNGLNSYDEFYNSFYTLPDEIIENDWFVGYSIDRLDQSYAKSRGYAKWAKEMVGHWQSTGYFYNTNKGIWCYSIFDMLTKSNQNYIYGDLYTSASGRNKKKQEIYNTEGFVIYQNEYNWKTGKTYKKTTEINFGVGRFVTAVVNTENSWFNKDELIKRAESLQIENSTKNEKPVI